MSLTNRSSDIMSLVASRFHLNQERSGWHVYAVKRPAETIAAELADVNQRLIDMLPAPSSAPHSFPVDAS